MSYSSMSSHIEQTEISFLPDAGCNKTENQSKTCGLLELKAVEVV